MVVTWTCNRYAMGAKRTDWHPPYFGCSLLRSRIADSADHSAWRATRDRPSHRGRSGARRGHSPGGPFPPRRPERTARISTRCVARSFTNSSRAKPRRQSMAAFWDSMADARRCPMSSPATTDEHLRAVGLSRQKLSYLKDLASRVASNELPIETLHELADDEVIGCTRAHQGRRSLDGADVPDVPIGPTGRAARARSRYTEGDPTCLSAAQASAARACAQDRRGVGAVSHGGVLVPLAKSRARGVTHRT